ncbi:vacuolar protein sorting-associated protein 8 [Ceratobasidium sp. AG-Ba]|nr:vacuolar protein sorting-associated protein 8 [Ceratobasidium sp. AG-Ba]QRW08285.1 vacuolar protein sorting-associated protein 8 [Ceratobasidium sp. AG-Ba]
MSHPPRSPSLKSQSTARGADRAEKNEFEDEENIEISGEDTHDERDYSTRMDEVLEDDEEAQGSDEEMFTYSGVDAPEETSGDYSSQLHDILGPDYEDELEGREVEAELSRFDDSDEFDKQNLVENFEPQIPQEVPTILIPETPPRLSSPAPQDPLKRPAFLHPTVSRLRSFVPQDRPSPASHASFASQRSANALGAPSAAASHFSAISRSSSISRFSEGTQKPTRDAFRWTSLHTASSLTHPASSLYGRATVLAANGLLCIGTSSSRVLVFDFRQQLKHVITPPTSLTPLPGPVTAVALSTDHTFVAVGHAQGHIFLYDLSRSQSPVRSVIPVALKAVLAGRKEGHLAGTPVTHVGFVGARHTAIVSADSAGLAFYHSLGKVLFVEASDVVRILGKYPSPGEGPVGPAPEAPLRPDAKGKGKAVDRVTGRAMTATSALSIASLPLGTALHSTDSYLIQALITPAKMIIVGLKPTPKTWLRRHNPSQKPSTKDEPLLAWFPAFAPSEDSNKQTNRKDKTSALAPPVLVYTWGYTLYFIRVKEERITQKIRDEKSGKIQSIEVGSLAFEELGAIELGADGGVRALQWLNVQQILVVTRLALHVYDVQSREQLERFQLDPSWVQSLGVASGLPLGSVSHSVKVYKGKTFLLGQDEIRVGTLLSWADHILNHVKAGDFLGSINLARDYYTSTAQGSTYGLPPDPKPIVGAKLLELMTSSAQFAFSEQRMREGSGANTDPTLYPGLVEACARACAAMGDMSFLYDELWEEYAEHGIGPIFLDTLQPLVLDGIVPSNVPPVVAQRLVMHCDERGEYTQAEKLIWHIDPGCIDVHHAIGLCKRQALYDALVYVYNAGLRDYVSPIVEFLYLIREIQKRRREEAGSMALATYLEDAVPNAYKVYDYLGSVLSGIAYPSKRRIEAGADQAKADIYAFLCFGRSSTWAGKLVLTAEGEGGSEPPYPYLRQLLRFDAEALLNALDLAFEDSYLNTQHETVNRQVIVNILMDMLSTSHSQNMISLPDSALSFIRIFIARNVPKYTQFIHISPTALQRLLIALASDPDPDTCEDRQLAAEFLLSIYNPSGELELREYFQRAGFFRILRSMYRSEKQWLSLAEAYLLDPTVGAQELFTNLEDILNRTKDQTMIFKGIVDLLENFLAPLLQLGLVSTAYILDKFAPELHSAAMANLNAEHLRFKYLRALVQPHLAWEADDDDIDHPVHPPSKHLDADLQREYLALMCREEPDAVLPLLRSDSGPTFGADQVVEVCAERKLFDVIIWVIDRDKGALPAIQRLEEFEQAQSAELVQWLSKGDNEPYSDTYPTETVARLKSLASMGVRLCEKDRREELWFQLLRSQIRTVQNTVSIGSIDLTRSQPLINELRSIIQATFSSLTAQSSSEKLSFPRLFRRLLDTSQEGVLPTKNTYTEFRLILTGMLETYRAEGDVLGITKRLMEQDLFEVVQEHVHARQRGWKTNVPICAGCSVELRATVTSEGSSTGEPGPPKQGPFVLMASGIAYHQACAPVVATS